MKLGYGVPIFNGCTVRELGGVVFAEAQRGELLLGFGG
jgi:hypothetical protein